MTTVTGVIIREKRVGENDKILTVLTRECGLIEITAKGALKMGSKNGSNTQLFMYSRLCFNDSRGRYYINSSESVNSFYNIRLDVKKYALACYFSDIILYTIQQNEQCDIITRLLLNTLYFLDNGKTDCSVLKPIFEFRHICEIGMRPQLLCCRNCCRYSTDLGLDMYFDMRGGTLVCEDCYEASDDDSGTVKLRPRTVENLRYIALTDYKDLFKLRPDADESGRLSLITERYLQIRLGRSFRSLGFYKSI